MDKEDVVHIDNRPPAIKKNKILPSAAKWMDLEGIMLSEIKSDKEKYCTLSLICGI